MRVSEIDIGGVGRGEREVVGYAPHCGNVIVHSLNSFLSCYKMRKSCIGGTYNTYTYMYIYNITQIEEKETKKGGERVEPTRATPMGREASVCVS